MKQDIYSVFDDKGPKPTEDQIKTLSDNLARLLSERLNRKEEPHLRVSRLGNPDRKLWYSINAAEKGDPLDGQTKLKFLYGEIIEQLVLFLCSVSGHEVKGTQTQVDINGVKGHLDSIIDGVLCDVKSASSFAYRAFDPWKKDSFGYVDQLNAYLYGLQDNPELKVKKEAFFLVVNKENGDIKTVTLKSNGVDYKKKVEEKRAVVALESPPPEKCYPEVPNDSKGNMVLHKECSWCPFKKECWKDSNSGAGLIAMPYSDGPRYFTKMVDPPKLKNKEF